jgi:YVTN family beta-propeller protein
VQSFRLVNQKLMATLAVCGFAWAVAYADPDTKADKTPLPDYRRPVDLLLDHNDQHLMVACAATGDLEIYHTQSNEHLASLHLDQSLDSIERLNETLAAVCSTKSHRTHVVSWTGASVRLIATIENSHSPIRLHWDNQTQHLYTACLWSRRIDCVSLASMLPIWSDPTYSVSSTIPIMKPDQVWDVPIAPRMLVSLPNARGLVVTDSFNRELLVLSQTTGKVLVRHDFFGTSIRGLTTQGNQLVALHSMLNEFARTDQNEIHWGVLMANDVRLVDIDLLLNERGDQIYVGGRVNPVGVPGNGAAEPTDMAVHATTGKVAVSVGGTDQVAIGRTDGYTYQYVDVGRYPTAVAWSSDGKSLFVANQFDDSISVVDVPGLQVSSVISQGPMRPMSDAEMGEQLFHSATLSHDRWLTCASCHVDGHTNGQLSDNFGDRTFGAPKRVPSLMGIRGTTPFTWLGHETKLQSQIVASIRKTMHSYRKLDPDEVEHLAAYMESLPPVISLASARQDRNDTQIAQGQTLFESKGCAECHMAPLYTSQDVYDVGIIDEKKQRLFNPPSLRGVSQRGPELFHDNRAEGLRGVLVDQKHQLPTPLSESELADLMAFLNSL